LTPTGPGRCGRAVVAGPVRSGRFPAGPVGFVGSGLFRICSGVLESVPGGASARRVRSRLFPSD